MKFVRHRLRQGGLFALLVPATAGCAADDDGPTERAGMMLIPAGPFWRGCDVAVDEYCERDPEAEILLDVPYRELVLSEFWIDKYEVTAEEYGECELAGACTAASGGLSWSEVEEPDVANLPVTGVTWHQAEAYCRWQGKVLPTEAQWEKAARGTDGRKYPWGNEPPVCREHAHLNFPVDDCERIPHVLPVDAYPGDLSPFGVVGMEGNVAEWVADWTGKHYYATCPTHDPPGPPASDTRWPDRVIRGGYWDASADGATVYLRRWADPEKGIKGRIGIRCARASAPD